MQNVLIFIGNASVFDDAVCRQQLGDGFDGHGFTGTGFTDNRQRFTFIQVKINTAKRLHLTSVGIEPEFKILHLKDAFAFSGILSLW